MVLTLFPKIPNSIVHMPPNILTTNHPNTTKSVIYILPTLSSTWYQPYCRYIPNSIVYIPPPTLPSKYNQLVYLNITHYIVYMVPTQYSKYPLFYCLHINNPTIQIHPTLSVLVEILGRLFFKKDDSAPADYLILLVLRIRNMIFHSHRHRRTHTRTHVHVYTMA